MISFLSQRTLEIPEDVEVTMNGKNLTFTGPMGTQSYDTSLFRVNIAIEGNEIKVRRWHANRKANALVGTIASHIRNYMVGVKKGYKYVLRTAYKHFTINMSVENNGKTIVVKNFLGAKTTRNFNVLGESRAYIGELKDILIIEGINLDHVSQTASQINNFFARKKSGDCRIFLDGIYIAERLHNADDVVVVN